MTTTNLSTITTYFKVTIPGHPEYGYTKTFHRDPTCSTWPRQGEPPRSSEPATVEEVAQGRLCTRKQCQRTDHATA